MRLARCRAVQANGSRRNIDHAGVSPVEDARGNRELFNFATATEVTRLSIASAVRGQRALTRSSRLRLPYVIVR